MIKLSISYEELIVTLFIGPLLLVSLFNITVFLNRNIRKTFVKYKDYFAFRKKMKEIERRKKEEGFLHSWATVKHPMVGEVTVCKETGFCPTLYGFFDPKWVVNFLDSEKRTDEVLKEREVYFDKRLFEIGQESGLDFASVRSIADKVLVINKEFTIQKLESLKNELKNEEV
jgi:hypothetical protein